MKISNITEAKKILQQYIPDVTKYYNDGLSLDRMWPLLELAENPHKKLKVVHLAGTSGKTSTAYYISSLLYASGKKVGLTISPHVNSVMERLQIDGSALSEDEFCSDLGEFLELVEEADPKPSYFELVIVFVLWVFVRREVDYAIVETGLGGLMDGSNVITRGDKTCVITDIGIDHTNILGDSLREIAAQKAGIIHANNDVYMYHQADEIMQPFLSRISEKNALLHTLSFEEKLEIYRGDLSMLPSFQKRNWLLAYSICQALADKGDFEISNTLDPLRITIPGRMERVQLSDNSTLILDGAHNGQKMTAFVEAYKELYPDQKATVLLGLKEGKEYKEVIDAIAPIVDSLVLTTFATTQDLPVVSQSLGPIAKYAVLKNLKVVTIEDSKKAYTELVKKPGTKIVTGSLYLLGLIHERLATV